VDLPLRDLNVFIGANGSGKSNFLEILALLKAAPRSLPDPIKEMEASGNGSGKEMAQQVKEQLKRWLRIQMTRWAFAITLSSASMAAGLKSWMSSFMAKPLNRELSCLSFTIILIWEIRC